MRAIDRTDRHLWHGADGRSATAESICAQQQWDVQHSSGLTCLPDLP